MYEDEPSKSYRQAHNNGSRSNHGRWNASRQCLIANRQTGSREPKEIGDTKRPTVDASNPVLRLIQSNTA